MIKGRGLGTRIAIIVVYLVHTDSLALSCYILQQFTMSQYQHTEQTDIKVHYDNFLYMQQLLLLLMAFVCSKLMYVETSF